MKEITSLIGSVALLVGLSAGSSSAATLIVNGGELQGATDVVIDGMLYNVLFQDGTCIAAYSGCDELSDFTFTSQSDAYVASEALLDQVFIDGPVGFFDSRPELSAGVSDSTNVFFTPYALGTSSGRPLFTGSAAFNLSDGAIDIIEGRSSETIDFDYSQSSFETFAVWTATGVAAPIPLPTGALLLLTGLGTMTAVRRCKKTAN